MSNIQVVALQRGHDGTAIREPGEEFSVDAKRLKDGSTWFVPADTEAFAAYEKAEAEKAKSVNKQPPGAGPAKGTKSEDNVRAPGAGPIPQTSDIA